MEKTFQNPISLAIKKFTPNLDILVIQECDHNVTIAVNKKQRELNGVQKRSISKLVLYLRNGVILVPFGVRLHLNDYKYNVSFSGKITRIAPCKH